jgi:hypothetical protein
MGGTEIEIKEKNKYTLTEYTCKGNFIQKGSYDQLGNSITLKVNKKTTGFSYFIMDNNKLFADGNFVISRKIQASNQPERFSKDEVFLYFLKM